MIRLNDEFVPPPASPEIPQLLVQLQTGTVNEREEALVKLVAAGAEEELAGCLTAGDRLAAHLATSGLWECWLNERGPEARRKMDEATSRMDAGDLADAEEIFRHLIRK